MSATAGNLPPWPAMSLARAHALLTAPGARFEMEEVVIRGVRTRCWKNAPPQERAAVESLLGRQQDGVNWALIRLAQSSVASLSVVPLQDVLGLGSEARLNTPNLPEGNYHWRYQPGSLKPELTTCLASLAEVTDRLPPPVAFSAGEDFIA